MERGKHRKGFTLVELSLSMVFISTLSLTVVLVIAGAVSSYHKSLTLNQINTVGTDVVDDMRMSVQGSPATSIKNKCSQVFSGGASDDCVKDKGYKLVSVTRRASVSLNGSKISNSDLPVYGAFCTGKYSYIWNSGYFFSGDGYVVGTSDHQPASLQYKKTSDGASLTESNFRLLKVKDKQRAVCIAALKVRNGRAENQYKTDSINGGGSVFNIALDGIVNEGEAPVVDEDPSRLISDGEGGLALYDLTTSISEQEGVSKNIFYYTSLILGTTEGGVNISTNGSFCEVPEGYNDGMVENFDYCAINKFNFAAMANGG